MGIRVEEEEALPGTMGKKFKKNKKNEVNASEEVGDCTGAVPNRVEDSFKLNKEDKKKKKDKKKHEIYSDVQVDGNHNVAVNVMDYAEVDNTYQKEKDRKKKRKLEAAEDKDASNNECHLEVEEKRSLQANDANDSGCDSGLKTRKYKKGHKENRKEVGSDTVLSSMEILENNNIRKDEGVKRQKSSAIKDITEMKNGEEGARKKNKGGRDKENGDVKGDRKITNGKEVGEARENCDGDNMEKVEKKKRKSVKKKAEDDLGAGLQEIMGEERGNESTAIEDKDFVGGEGNAHLTRNKTLDRETKKKRKLEAVEDKDASNNVTHMGGEEKRSLQTNNGKDSGCDSRLEASKDKKGHKENRRKDGSYTVLSSMNFLDNNIRKDEGVKRQKGSDKEAITEMKKKAEGAKKKNKNGRRDKEHGDVKGDQKITDGKDMEKVEKKKRKSVKKKGEDDLGAGLQETMDEGMCNESTFIEDKDFVDREGNSHSPRNKTLDRETKNGNKGKKKKPDSVEIGSKDPKSKGKSKKVRFSGHVEVFPSSHDPSTENEVNQGVDLVRGKRFSREEDEMIKEAVLNYIKVHSLGEEGLNMVLHCKSHPEIKTCWKEIGTVLPHRPYQSTYYRAHMLFERDERRAWTPEEYELVRKFHEEHGPDWRKLAGALGKYRVHVKDTWRRIKLPNIKTGHWAQEEYQNLFDLVNMDLRMKTFEEKKSKHGMLRDNICWGTISDKLSTRSDATCCTKWYNQLTSPMVAEGEWADADDYRLLIALFSLDACCIEDVDWDYLLDHRSGDVCRKRWNQMVCHIGKHWNKSFAEQVEILSKRYCPDILESREIWDSKPRVP